MSDKALKNIFLNKFHQENGAKFVPFAGYEMPINYKKGIINEHLHVREKIGIFDVSHMGQILIPANDKNISELETYIPLNLKKIQSNKCHYSFILNKEGGIVDDIMLSKIYINKKENIYIVYNASRKKILNEIFSNICENYSIINNRCLIAIQGPSSYLILKDFLDLSKVINFLDIGIFDYKNENIIVSRSGYTGEDGFEISIKNQFTEKLVENLIESGAKLIGLGARNTLRLEAGLCLYGQDIDIKTSPIEANLKWAISKKRINTGGFPGYKKIKSQLNLGVNRLRVGIKPESKIIAREKTKIFSKDNKNIGEITSGTFGPSLQIPVAMGYVDQTFSKIDTKIFLEVRGKRYSANICSLPFYKKSYVKGEINE